VLQLVRDQPFPQTLVWARKGLPATNTLAYYKNL
jgi:hypothetical protein